MSSWANFDLWARTMLFSNTPSINAKTRSFSSDSTADEPELSSLLTPPPPLPLTIPSPSSSASSSLCLRVIGGGSPERIACIKSLIERQAAPPFESKTESGRARKPLSDE